MFTHSARCSGSAKRRSRIGRTAGVALIVSLLAAGSARAVSPADVSIYSHKGFKGTIALGTLHNTSTVNLNNASSFGLGLGYGINQNVSLWLNVSGSEHKRSELGVDPKLKTDVGGLDLALQYRFLPNEQVQPYGKIGIGAYSTEETDTHNARAGTGIHVGAGADYFFTRHFGIGAEVSYRSLRYTQERTGRKGDFEEMDRALDGDATGIAVTFTVQ